MDRRILITHNDAIGSDKLSGVMFRLANLEYQIVERLSSDENGELLLQPLGYCRDLVHGLAGMAVDEGLPLERRTDSARALLGITQKAAQEHIVFVNARAVCVGQPFKTRRPFNTIQYNINTSKSIIFATVNTVLFCRSFLSSYCRCSKVLIRRATSNYDRPKSTELHQRSTTRTAARMVTKVLRRSHSLG